MISRLDYPFKQTKPDLSGLASPEIYLRVIGKTTGQVISVDGGLQDAFLR